MILQEIQPYCDALAPNLKAEKERQHLTLPRIAEETGVPEHTVAKFFSGSLSNPSVHHVAAYCRLLGVSMDALYGMDHPQTDPELRQELAVTKMDLARTREQMEIYKKGVSDRRPVIYGLAGMCVLLFALLTTYIVLDALNPDVGLIRSTGTSPAVLVCVSAFVLTVLYTARSAAKRRKK